MFICFFIGLKQGHLAGFFKLFSVGQLVSLSLSVGLPYLEDLWTFFSTIANESMLGFNKKSQDSMSWLFIQLIFDKIASNKTGYLLLTLC
jgi:hypothetical protein